MKLWPNLALVCSLLTARASLQAANMDRPITDEVFYFMVLDRFNDGDPSNNKGFDRIPVPDKDSKEDIARHGYQPTLESFYHGGDFQGIVQKLDYLQGLGVTSILLSPILKNRATQGGDEPSGAASGYHGNWILDFTTVDPHWGTEQDFRDLIEASQKRGIKVFIDLIINNTADVIRYRECRKCPYRSLADYPYATIKNGKKLNDGFVDGDLSPENFAKLKDANYAYTPYIYDPKVSKQPDWLNDITLYHNRGNSSFSGENSQLGDLYGLDDLMTEHPKVVQGLIAIYVDWVKKYKFDGFRINAVKHVDSEFWEQFIPAIRQAAKEAGVANFYMFGEVSSSDPETLSRYNRLGKFDSVLDFGLQSTLQDVFAGEQSPDRLHDYVAQDDLHRLTSAPQKMLNFVSNQDIGRLAYFIKEHFKTASEDELLKRLALAHAYLYFARGVPIIYYGDEQGFVGKGGELGARQDMFASKVASYQQDKHLGATLTPDKASFDTHHPLYKTLATFARIRQSHALLRTGEYQPIRDIDKDLFAFRRSSFDANEEYLVIFNLSPKSRTTAFARNGFSMVYPEATLGETLTLPALSFAIVKGLKPKASNRSALAIDFSNLDNGQRVANLFYGEVKMPVEGEYKIGFATKTAKDKDFIPLYTDYNPPYRAYIDGASYPQGTELWLKAEVTSRSGQKASVQRKLLLDSRP